MVGERARPCASPLAPRQRTRCLTRSAGCPAWRRAGWQRGCGGKEAAALCAGVGGGVYGRARFFAGCCSWSPAVARWSRCVAGEKGEQPG